MDSTPTSNNNEALSPGVNEYVPPKGWEEITDTEKIERLREIIKGMQYTLNRIDGQFHTLSDSFEKHEHNGSKIVIPYNRYSNSFGGGLVGDSSLAKGTKAFF